jgi:hypothetical protein
LSPYQPLFSMNFFRQYIAPPLVVIIFLLALIAVSARIFLPSDLAAPAPIIDEDLSTIIVTPLIVKFEF